MPESEHSDWTTFSMPLREPGPPPTPFDFIRFLASSITFMARLSEVSVFFDGRCLANLKKDRGVPRPLGLRKGLKAETAKGTMKVTAVSAMRECLWLLSTSSRIVSYTYFSPTYQSRGYAMGICVWYLSEAS